MARKTSAPVKNMSAAAISGKLREQARSKFGKNASPNKEKFMEGVYGLSLRKYLPLQYLLGTDVLALGRTMSLIGPTSGGKSALSWFIMGLFHRAGGLIQFLDVEKKTDPLYYMSCANIYDKDEFNDAVIPSSPGSLDDLLNMLVWHLKEYDTATADGSMPMFPMGMVVDSLGAAISDKAKTAINDQGDSIGYDGMHSAKAVTDVLRTMQVMMDHLPVLLVLINHMKLDKDGAITCPGGLHKDFANTWNFRVKEIGNSRQNKGNYWANMSIKALKSSLGPNDREIVLKRTQTMGDDGMWHVDFDWDGCLVTLLHKQAHAGALRDLLGLSEITGAREGSKKVSSSVMGLKDVNVSEMGAAIHALPDDMYYGVQRLLDITRRKVYDIDEGPPGRISPSSSSRAKAAKEAK